MKCSKCGFEYESGRECPKCGANAILIHEDYYRRRQKWEEKNAAPKEEEEQAPKFLLSPAIKKRIWKAALMILFAAAAGYGIVAAVREYFRTHVYAVGFVSETQQVSSCDGAFLYEKAEAFAGVPGESRELFCSADGMSAAMVLYEEAKEKYCLYVSHRKESRLAYETENVLGILRVNGDGSVLVRELEQGEYDVVTECRIIEVSENVRTLAQEDMSVIETGKDRRYCLYQEGRVLFWENGKLSSAYVENAGQIVCAGDDIYYLQEDVLYDAYGNERDSKVLAIFHVYGTDELLYLKENQAVLVEANGRCVKFETGEIGADLQNVKTWLRCGSKIYANTGENLVVLDKNKRNAAVLRERTSAYLYRE